MGLPSFDREFDPEQMLLLHLYHLASLCSPVRHDYEVVLGEASLLQKMLDAHGAGRLLVSNDGQSHRSPGQPAGRYRLRGIYRRDYRLAVVLRPQTVDSPALGPGLEGG
ncbi:hypothetical protein SDC9_170453 [bioreactor metagenome]|uniref:Uncharacterized protein n=1 Tax=bioreactor metagenome TaxID=1076179 RepID=A0A645G849_9ZZZZ